MYIQFFSTTPATIIAKVNCLESFTTPKFICNAAKKIGPVLRDGALWSSYGLPQGIRCLYVGLVAREKNLELLANSATGKTIQDTLHLQHTGFSTVLNRSERSGRHSLPDSSRNTASTFTDHASSTLIVISLK